MSNKSRLGSLYKNLDFFGFQFNLRENGKKRYKTYTGALLSSFIWVTCIVLAFMFGVEIYERKIPMINTSEEFQESSIIYLKNMPFVFSMFTDEGIIINNINEYITIVTSSFIIHKDYTVSYEFNKLKLKSCADVKYNRHQAFVDEAMKVGANSQCLDHDESTFLKNAYTERDSSYLTVQFVKCNPQIKKCADDLDKQVASIYVQMYFLDTFIDSSNYESPVQFYGRSETQQINHKFLKRNYFRFSTNKYISDNGWILEDLKTEQYIKLSSSRFDMAPVEGTPLEDHLYWITLESPRLRTIYKRQYMKIQELFAKIGGLVKGITLAIQILTYQYFRFDYIMYLFSLYGNIVEKNNNHIQNIPINIFNENQRQINNNNSSFIKNSFTVPLKNNFLEEKTLNKEKIRENKTSIELNGNYGFKETQVKDKQIINKLSQSQPLQKTKEISLDKDSILILHQESLNYLVFLYHIFTCDKTKNMKFNYAHKYYKEVFSISSIMKMIKENANTTY